MLVAVTGAGGRIGTILATQLPERFSLRPVTRPPARPGGVAADLADPGSLAAAFRGCDAVIHLAAVAHTDASWEEILATNIAGCRNVFEAARMSGVPRVVLASSNHVVGMLEEEAGPALYELGDPRVLDHRAELRPDSLYGVSKAFGEALARYHVERHGMASVCLRIGSVVDAPDPGTVPAAADVWHVTPPEVVTRLRATWLSHRDCAALFAAALEAPVRWAVVYGTSANPRHIWDLAHARDTIGYVPADAAPAWLWPDVAAEGAG